MDSTSTEILNKILDDSTVVNKYFVNVNPIHTVVNDYSLPIRLPFLNDTVLLFANQYVKYLADTNFVWNGILNEYDSIPSHSGYGTLISREGKTFGSFLVDSIHFDLIDLGGSNNVLVQYMYDTTKAFCGVGLNDSIIMTPDPPDSSLIAELRGTGPCPIKVLVLYTERGKNRVPDIIQTANLSFEMTLTALHNSRIRDSEFYLELVGVEYLPLFDEFIAVDVTFDQNLNQYVFPPAPTAYNNFTSFIVDEIQDNTSEMSILKEETNADFVIILGLVDPFVPGLRGFAVQGLNEDAPVAVVSAEHSVRNYLFAHELGHLFGCNHEECSVSWKGGNCKEEHLDARHAHSWTTGWAFWKERRYTVMFSNDVKETRGFFSNPNVKVANGSKTGTPMRNNAKWMKDVGCVISQWRSNPTFPPLHSYISGPEQACPCEFITITANVQGGGPGAYTYDWSYSFDGVNFINYPYNTPSAYLQMPCPTLFFPTQGKGLYVRLDVTDYYNDTHHSWYYIKLEEMDDFGFDCFTSPMPRVVREINNIDIVVFPNPTSGYVNIEVNNINETSHKLNFSMFNSIGNVLLSDELRVNNDINSFSINIERFPKGLYFLKIYEGIDQSEVQTFTIINQ